MPVPPTTTARPFLIRALWVLALIATALCAWIAYRLDDRPSLEALQIPTVSPRAASSAHMSITFTGVATVIIDDGQTILMTDGFFSRPSFLRVLATPIGPDETLINRGLSATGLSQNLQRIAAIIPVHSHYDHAMDAPVIVKKTKAVLLGSASSLNIARGQGVSDSQLQQVVLNKPYQFGAFSVTMYPSHHAPTGFTGGTVDRPLTTPAHALRYKEGDSYAVLITHGTDRILINGSAGFVPGALKGVQADVVLLGIGTLGKLPADYQRQYWSEVVEQTGAKVVIPIHWDDFVIDTPGQLLPLPRLIDNVDQSLQTLSGFAKASHVKLQMPLAYHAMDPWAEQ